MRTRKLRSCLAEKMQCFIDLRRLSGTDYQGQAQLLGYFDRFLVEQRVGQSGSGNACCEADSADTLSSGRTSSTSCRSSP